MYPTINTVMVVLLVTFFTDGALCEENQPPMAEIPPDVDMVFMLDSSSNVPEENFNVMLEFVKGFVDKFDIDSGSARVGVLTFSSEASVQFQLNNYFTKAEVLYAINDIVYAPGLTNPAEALRAMHEDMFTVGNGDRPEVANVAFLISSDGILEINKQLTIQRAVIAHEKDILVFAIGIGPFVVREALEAIASPPPREHSVIVRNFDELVLGVDTIYRHWLSSIAME